MYRETNPLTTDESAKMSVLVKLLGGLGNQMFQYAMGRRLVHGRKASLHFDVRELCNDPQRSFALDGFCIVGRVANAAELRKGLPWQAWLHPRFTRRLAAFPSRVHYVRECGYTFEPVVLESTVPAYVEGYWQSERYFAPIADVVRADFMLAEPLTAMRRVIADKIAACEAISVHVRRGDYVSNPVANAYHGTCAPEWYATAMELIAAGLNRPKFFVFSDDPAWARENLPGRWSCEFVAPQDDGRDFEDMHLMAMCRHHIIANSSFSWWGAWLDPHPEKRVIAPAHWFKGAGHDTRDLIPESWERL